MDEEAAYHQAHGAGIAQGVKMEGERIVALLEQMIMTPPRDDENIHAWRGKFRALSDLQALIKGEN
jgi:hypothetical protein